MLEVSRLTRRYGDVLAVDGVSFSIGKGEIVGLLGHNGAGKTTIMKMLSGYLEPNEGSIEIGGLNLARQTKRAQRELGYLPENLPVYPDMLVAEYLEFAAEMRGLHAHHQYREIRRVVAATEIGDRLTAPIATLSRGLKQRVGVAQAILGRPHLLILDEPTNGLDPTQTEHMRQLIRDLASEATVILSTHIMQEVDALCDRVLILSGGQLAIDARLHELHTGNRVLVSTSLPPDQARTRLAAIGGVAAVEVLPGEAGSEGFDYRVELAVGGDGERRATCAAITRALVEGGAQLYSLHREHRDLETLFRRFSRAPLVGAASQERMEGPASDVA